MVVKCVTLVHISREDCDYAHRDQEDYDHFIELLGAKLSRLKHKYSSLPSTEEGKVLTWMLKI